MPQTLSMPPAALVPPLGCGTTYRTPAEPDCNLCKHLLSLEAGPCVGLLPFWMRLSRGNTMGGSLLVCALRSAAFLLAHTGGRHPKEAVTNPVYVLQHQFQTMPVIIPQGVYDRAH